MWIDAICINQEDKAEHSSQIFLMGDIYKGVVSTVKAVYAKKRRPE